jgi:hypothetical protein
VAPQPPTIVYAMPRNAAPVEDFNEDDGDGDDEREDDGDGSDAVQTSDSPMGQVIVVLDKVQKALQPAAEIAKVVTAGGGLGAVASMFGLGGGRRNAAPAEIDESSPPDSEAGEAELAEPAMPAHLRTSHVLLISHELGAEDGSLFRRMLMAMEPDDRRLFAERLCAMPIEEAVPFAADQIARLKARRAARATARAPQDGAAPTGAARAHESMDHADEPDADLEPLTAQEVDTGDESDGAEVTDDTEPAELNAEPMHEAPSVPPRPVAPAPAEQASTRPVPSIAPLPHQHAAPARKARRPLTPHEEARLQQIGMKLGLAEMLQIQGITERMSNIERDAWIGFVVALDTDEAVQVVRTELARRAPG